MLVQVTTSKFCAGVIIERDHVVEAAPILAHTIGWHRYKLTSYYRSRGGRVEAVW